MALETELPPRARQDTGAELLFAEAQARRRRLRRRGAFFAVVLVAGLLFGLDHSNVIGSVGSSTGGGPGGGTSSSATSGPVATSSDALLNPYYLDPQSLGDHAEFWYSNNGSVEEEYVYGGIGYTYSEHGYSGNGALISVERSSYRVVGVVGQVTTTVVFPAQHAFATYTTFSKGEAGDVFYLSAPFIRRGLADHTLVAWGPGTQIDGRRGVRLTGTQLFPFLGWVDPRNDEMISTTDLRSIGSGTYVADGSVYYRWLPGTKANLTHLELFVKLV